MADNPTSVENTSARDPLQHLLGIAEQGQGTYIQAMERAGQEQLVASDVLPVEILGGSRGEMEALGFEFGPPRRR